MTAIGEIVLEARGLSKTYPNGTKAVEGVSFTLRRGEIHAVVGENGAGKSTIMKMLYGLEQPTSGEILLEGQPVRFTTPQDAIDRHIGLVHQHLMLIERLTVAENVTLGHEIMRGFFLDRMAMQTETSALAKRFGMDLNPAAQVKALAVGQKQRIEILKALYKGAEILLLDEPTAVLTPQETRDLFVALRGLVEIGMTVVFITHKLAEVKAVADRITVMRDGRVTGQVNAADVTPLQIAEMMVGRPVSYIAAPRRQPEGQPVVQVRNLTVIATDGHVEINNVTFDIWPGEILGIAGVEGNGQSALGKALIGLVDPAAGEGLIAGAVFTGQGVAHARSLGVANVPEDRIHDGIAAALSIEENFVAGHYRQAPFAQNGLLQLARITESARAMISAFEVKAQSEKAPIGALSGGNMQKVLLGREFAGNPRLLIAAQPTRGVDIGAAEGLRQRLIDLRDAGTAILLISADLEEVIALSDRIAVFCKGEIVGQFPSDTIEENELGLYMLGAKRQLDSASA
jgi:simple sugar transport system ATP-binding protein